MRQTPTTTVGNFAVTVVLPESIAAGTFRPSIDCSNGFSGFARLRVNPVPGEGALTGDGTASTSTGSPLTAGAADGGPAGAAWPAELDSTRAGFRLPGGTAGRPGA